MSAEDAHDQQTGRGRGRGGGRGGGQAGRGGRGRGGKHKDTAGRDVVLVCRNAALILLTMLPMKHYSSREMHHIPFVHCLPAEQRNRQEPGRGTGKGGRASRGRGGEPARLLE
eukprot:scaffold261905_cov17-Tisochrysis_lutea.AAC.1